jgi:tetratricopeptide (TPR) repeat protein
LFRSTQSRFLLIFFTAVLITIIGVVLDLRTPTPEEVQLPIPISPIPNYVVQTNSVSSQRHILSASPTIAVSAVQQVQVSCEEKLKSTVFAPEAMADYERRMAESMRGIVGEWFYIKGAQPNVEQLNSTPEKFFFALASAQLLRGLTNQVQLNYDLALQLLDEVATSDPNNSAPLLFSAAIYEQQNKFPEAQAYIQEALQATDHFNSYLLEFNRALVRYSLNAEDYYRSIFVRSSHPVPDQLIIKNLIVKYKLTPIALQLIKDGASKDTLFQDYEWSVLDYALGFAAMKTLLPTYKIPNFNELIIQKNNFHRFDAQTQFNEFQRNCDPTTLEDVFVLIKNRI